MSLRHFEDASIDDESALVVAVAGHLPDETTQIPDARGGPSICDGPSPRWHSLRFPATGPCPLRE